MKEVRRVQETPFIDIIRDTWPMFQDNWAMTIGIPAFLSYVPFLVVGLPICIIAFIVALVVGLINKDLVVIAMLPLGLVAGLAFAVAYNLVRVGWTRMTLQLIRGNKIEFDDLKKAMPWFVNFLIVNLIIGVATTIGGFLLIVPGVFIAVRTCMAPYLVVDENLGPIEALMRSNDLVTGYSWQILGYFCFLFLGNLVAGAIPGISLALIPACMGFFDVTLARIYDYRRQITAG